MSLVMLRALSLDSGLESTLEMSDWLTPASLASRFWLHPFSTMISWMASLGLSISACMGNTLFLFSSTVKGCDSYLNWPTRRRCAMGVSMGMYDEVRAKLREAVEKAGGQSSVSRMTGINQPSLSKFFKSGNVLGLDKACAMFEAFGAQIVFPDGKQSLTREIRWIDANVVPAGKGQTLPGADSYFAVPLVGEAGAGPGIMPTEGIKSWVLVYRHQHAVKFKKNLLAVEIERSSTSMVPLLNPGDIVLVNRDETSPERNGGIYLVREPGQEGGAMVKRVATKSVNGDTLITFYSENAADNPAETFSLATHYDGEINRAIVGRCLWAWSDIMGK